MRKLFFFALVCLLELPLLVSAQSFYAIRRERDLIINVGTGASRYFGELVNPGEIGKVRANINIGAEYFVTPRISARVDATWFQLSGSDALANDDRVLRNLSFFSNNIELDAMGSFQLFPNKSKFYQRPAFNVYGFAGVGLLRFNPKTKYQGDVVALQPLQTEGVKYNRMQFVIPMGMGVKYRINPWLNFAVEGTYRETFTDYLDDISSRRYTDPATLQGGIDGLSAKLSDRRKERDPDYPLDFTGGIRGNPDSEDSYFILTAKAQIYIPTKFGQNRKLYSTKRKAYKNKGGMFKIKRNQARPKNRR